MNLDKLFIMSIGRFMQQNSVKTIQWEDVVKSCFENFPEAFSFEKYKNWPDTLKIQRCVLHCIIDKKWMEGNNKLGFFLTDLGRDILMILSKKDLPVEDVKERKKGVGTDYMLIKNIKDSDAFKRFLSGENDLNESNFRYLLRCTSESTERTLKQNFRYIKQSAENYGEKRVIDFLDKYKEKFKNIFE